VEALLVDEAGPALAALELVVVTAAVTPRLVDRLVGRRMGHRHVSLVYADGAELPQPGLVRLQAAGIPVAVLRECDDLAVVLGGRPLSEAAHG
jgi:hypothetical protein